MYILLSVPITFKSVTHTFLSLTFNLLPFSCPVAFSMMSLIHGAFTILSLTITLIP